ncbi:MAG: hydrogenase formation protein HypD [Methanobacteriota archaeon]
MVHPLLKEVPNLGRTVSFMHVCGTHQDTLVKHGLEPLLAEAGVRIVQGPGCPVCVTTPAEIEMARALALSGKAVTAFGDMMNVPGPSGSLVSARSEGADVRIVYSVTDALAMARAEPGKEFVFMGIGFETTAPSTAFALLSDPPENFSILSCHRLVPPALEALLQMGEVKLDGLIEPGHVSAIIGTLPYEPISERWKVPQVVAGFEPEDLLMAVAMLAKQIYKGRAEVENEYSRVVKPEGNRKAIRIMEEAMAPRDVKWRGFPSIPGSGLGIRKRFEEWDAASKYQGILAPYADREYPEPEGCLCGEVLRGLVDARECPQFGKGCAPENPVGPCMVSAEGSCNIAYRYRTE